jgi:hypothetical protein
MAAATVRLCTRSAANAFTTRIPLKEVSRTSLSSEIDF